MCRRRCLPSRGGCTRITFDLFRREREKLSAVTIWGMADDDTWLDSFPVVRKDYPLPFDMRLQAKPAYWGIVDPTHLPGYGLKFSSKVQRTGAKQLTLTLTATNGDAGPAYTTQINGLTLKQTDGKSCTPTVTGGSGLPVVLGDIPVSGSASATFTIDLKGCSEHAEFVLTAPWSSAVYETGTYRREIEVEDERR